MADRVRRLDWRDRLHRPFSPPAPPVLTGAEDVELHESMQLLGTDPGTLGCLSGGVPAHRMVGRAPRAAVILSPYSSRLGAAKGRLWIDMWTPACAWGEITMTEARSAAFIRRSHLTVLRSLRPTGPSIEGS